MPAHIRVFSGTLKILMGIWIIFFLNACSQDEGASGGAFLDPSNSGSPVAALLPVPPNGGFDANVSFSLNVSAAAASPTILSQYKYKVLDASNAISSCASPSNYSAAVSVGIPLGFNLDTEGLIDGTSIKLCVVAQDMFGNWQGYDVATSYTWTRDTAAPSSPTVTDGLNNWSTTQSPQITWTSSSDGTGVGFAKFQVALGTTAGGHDVKDWYDIGTSTSTTITGLTLQRGTRYFTSVRAVDSLGNTSASGQGSGWQVNSEFPVTNSDVTSIATKGNQIYLGGAFTEIGSWTGAGVPLSPSTGAVSWPSSGGITTKARPNDAVNVSISDRNGGWYIGGAFTSIEGTARNYLAHILSNGSLDSNFNPNPNGAVSALVLSSDGSTLYIGGAFTSVGSNSRNYVAAVLTANGSVVSSFNPNLDNSVNALALSSNDSTLYIGGSFTQVGATLRNYLAAVQTANGSLISGFNAVLDGPIFGLLLSSNNNTLYLAGNFTDLGGIGRDGVAAVQTSNGSAITGFNALLTSGSLVNFLALSNDGNTLYMGGNFSTQGADIRNYLAAVQASTGAVISSFNTTLLTPLSALALSPDGSTIYFSGAFTTVNGVSKKFAAAVLASDGSLVTSFDPKPISSALALALSSDGSKLYMGGNFSTVNTITRNYLAAISTAGEISTSFNPSPNGIIYSLALSSDGSKLYMGGSFTSIGATAPVTRNRVASVLTSDGSVVSNFNPNANSVVRSMALSSDGTKLYIAGGFTYVNNVAISKVAAVNTSDGTLISAFSPPAISAGSSGQGIFTIALSGDESVIYLGGPLTTVAGVALNGVAALRTIDGALVPSFQANLNAGCVVYAMALSPDGNTLYLGGSFSSVGGASKSGIAAVKSNDGSLVTGFTATTNAFIRSLKVSSDGNSLYMGGGFTTVNSVSKGLLVQLQRTDGALVNTFNAGGIGSTVYAVATSEDGSTLYTGGSFTSIGGKISKNFAPLNITSGSWLPAF